MLGHSLYDRYRGSYGRYKRKSLGRLYRKVQNNEEKVIYRWQNVSRFGLGFGAQGLYTWEDAALQVQPLHMFDVTYIPNNTSSKDPLYGGMHSVNMSKITAALSYSGPLIHQDQNGDPIAVLTGTDVLESGVPATDNDFATLKWIDLKMNLYGSFSVPVKYRISLIRFTDEISVPGASNSAARAISQYESMVKPFKYSNLLTNTSNQSRAYSTIKEWNYTIQPLNKTEVWNMNMTGGEEVLSPHFIEFKEFIKLDRAMNYAWHDDPTVATAVTDKPSTDQFQVTNADVHSSPYPTSRIFLAIQCTSPKVDTTTNPLTAASTSTQWQWAGSYDICMRRCFYIPLK